MNLADNQSKIDLRLIRVWLKSSKTIYDIILQDIKRHELTLVNFMILEFLYNKGPHTVQKISEKLSIPTGSITHVVNKLVKKNYVKRTKSSKDRRSSNVVLTEEGYILFKKIFPKHVEVLSETLSSLNDEEKMQLTELLKKAGLGAKKKD